MSDNPKIDRLRELKAQARLGGGEKRIEQQHQKGRLTARERIDLFLDKGSFEKSMLLSLIEPVTLASPTKKCLVTT